MNKRTHTLLTFFLAIMLAFATLGLAGCGGGDKNEQDNCYGEDMPVVNDD